MIKIKRCKKKNQEKNWKYSQTQTRLNLDYLFPGNSTRKRGLLTVYIRIKVRLDWQADKSTIVAKGPFFPQVMNPRYRIRGTMCNARSNLISGKALILKRGFASNLLDHHQDSSSLPHTRSSKRKRGENQSKKLDRVFCWSSKLKKNVAKRISLKAWLPFRLWGHPFLSFTVLSLRGIILQVSTTRRVQEEQDENVW
jgi:hypothetical protein